jgi:hypothetical protein
MGIFAMHFLKKTPCLKKTTIQSKIVGGNKRERK